MKILPLLYQGVSMKERGKIVFAIVICIFAVASSILSFFDQVFLGVAVVFCISFFMLLKHRTALIPRKRFSFFVNNDFKGEFQALGKLKEYHTLTLTLSIFFFILGVLGMFVMIFFK